MIAQPRVRLGIVLIVWGSMLVWFFALEPEPQHVPLTHRTGETASRGEGSARPAAADPLDVRSLKNLHAQTTPTMPVKNVFAPLDLPPDVGPVRPRRTPVSATLPPPVVSALPSEAPIAPSPTALPAPLPATPTADDVARTQVEQNRLLVQQQAQQLLAQFRYLGFVSQGGTDRAFLGKGSEILIAAEGERVHGTVIVRNIGTSSVILKDTLSNVERTVSLSPNGS